MMDEQQQRLQSAPMCHQLAARFEFAARQTDHVGEALPESNRKYFYEAQQQCAGNANVVSSGCLQLRSSFENPSAIEASLFEQANSQHANWQPNCKSVAFADQNDQFCNYNEQQSASNPTYTGHQQIGQPPIGQYFAPPELHQQQARQDRHFYSSAAEMNATHLKQRPLECYPSLYNVQQQQHQQEALVSLQQSRRCQEFANYSGESDTSSQLHYLPVQFESSAIRYDDSYATQQYDYSRLDASHNSTHLAATHYPGQDAKLATYCNNNSWTCQSSQTLTIEFHQSQTEFEQQQQSITQERQQSILMAKTANLQATRHWQAPIDAGTKTTGGVAATTKLELGQSRVGKTQNGKSYSSQTSKQAAQQANGSGCALLLPSKRIAANSQKSNQCTVCGRNYARPSTLKTHLRTHTNERPFKCNVCFKTFSQAANLTAHQRVHTGERPFSCPICGRQFSQSSSVITHLRTHSGERPYRCNLCSRTFSDSSTLTKHCRIHSGEKPYQCDFCPLNFSQSGNLSRHLRLHQIRGLQMSNNSGLSSSSSSSSSSLSSSSLSSSLSAQTNVPRRLTASALKA